MDPLFHHQGHGVSQILNDVRAWLQCVTLVEDKELKGLGVAGVDTSTILGCSSWNNGREAVRERP